MKLVTRLSVILSLVTVLGIFTTYSTPYADAAYDIPDWVENLAGMWYSGVINDDAFGNALDWLINNDILTTPNTSTTNTNSIGSTFTNSTGTYSVISSNHNSFTNSTGTYSIIPSDTNSFTNSTGTYSVISSNHNSFTNSTGTYQLIKNLSGEGVWLWHMNTSVFTNSTGTYMQTSSGTYKIYE